MGSSSVPAWLLALSGVLGASSASAQEPPKFQSESLPVPFPAGAPATQPQGGLRLGDFDGDQRIDAAHVSGSTPLVHWAVTSFENTASIEAGAAYLSQDVAVHAGSPDRLVTAGSFGVALWAWDGAGFVEEPVSGVPARRVLSGDVDGDGQSELIALRADEVTVDVYHAGSKGWNAETSFLLPAAAIDLLLLDWNAGGGLEIAGVTPTATPVHAGDGAWIETLTNTGTARGAARVRRAVDGGGDHLALLYEFPLLGLPDYQFLSVFSEGGASDAPLYLADMQVRDLQGIEAVAPGSDDLLLVSASDPTPLLLFASPTPGPAFDLLSSYAFPPLADGSSEVPLGLAVDDLDNDGELDVLALRAGLEALYLGRNDSVDHWEQVPFVSGCLDIAYDPQSAYLVSLDVEYAVPSASAMRLTGHLWYAADLGEPVLIDSIDVTLNGGAPFLASSSTSFVQDAHASHHEVIFALRSFDASDVALPEIVLSWVDGAQPCTASATTAGGPKPGPGGNKTEGVDPRPRAALSGDGPPPSP